MTDPEAIKAFAEIVTALVESANKHGVSGEALAEAVRAHRVSISKAKVGDRAINGGQLMALCDVARVDNARRIDAAVAYIRRLYLDDKNGAAVQVLIRGVDELPASRSRTVLREAFNALAREMKWATA